MKSLIVPIAGKSSRFPNMRPKWMLTHPKSGELMCIESLKGLNLDFFDKIFFVYLFSQEEEFLLKNTIVSSVSKLNSEIVVEVVLLDEHTSSQSETVYQCIKKYDIEEFIYVKDADSYFECVLDSKENQVTYFDLNDIGEIDARSKSYISMDSNGLVTNIVEKRVISSTFSVGGYGFSDAKQFCQFYESVKNLPGECYVSNVIFQMILQEEKVFGLHSENFIDWGTLESWESYKKDFSTIFIDLDGTLITNSSHLMRPFFGEGKPLENNIEVLRKLKSRDKTCIVITTSRPERFREFTESELEKYGIPHDHLIMGLPHAKRILINDYSASNSYPTCESVNIPRNCDNLSDYLK